MENRDIPLEDDWTDVLRKAVRGQGITAPELARRSGLAISQVESLLGGAYNDQEGGAIARALGLDRTAFIDLAHGAYHPGEIVLPAGMAMFTSDWDGMAVHSYLAWDESKREAVAFDTGADATRMLGFLNEHGLHLRYLLLTHGHGDHVFETDRIVEKTNAEAWIGEGNGLEGIATFGAGREFRIGDLVIGTRLTKGHAPGGITYVIDGLSQPVAIVGDALFAGSMGGANTSYNDCLVTNREAILTLSPQTILCPGHGPLTTVALERRHNPFFPQN